MSGSRFTGGGQIGYNFQIDRAVLGIESDIDYFNIKGSRQVGGIYPGGGPVFPAGANFAISSSVHTNWLFTARGRAGWLLSNNLLAYATGGLAVTEIHVTHAFRDSALPVPGVGNWSGSKTKLGWTVGGGFEWALTRNWSVKAEYLYLNFGSVDAAGLVVEPLGAPSGYANAISTSADLSAHIARAGVNYKF
jgi:outer membrane immunogenic protein